MTLAYCHPFFLAHILLYYYYFSFQSRVCIFGCTHIFDLFVSLNLNISFIFMSFFTHLKDPNLCGDKYLVIMIMYILTNCISISNWIKFHISFRFVLDEKKKIETFCLWWCWFWFCFDSRSLYKSVPIFVSIQKNISLHVWENWLLHVWISIYSIEFPNVIYHRVSQR